MLQVSFTLRKEDRDERLSWVEQWDVFDDVESVPVLFSVEDEDYVAFFAGDFYGMCDPVSVVAPLHEQIRSPEVAGKNQMRKPFREVLRNDIAMADGGLPPRMPWPPDREKCSEGRDTGEYGRKHGGNLISLHTKKSSVP